MNWFTWYLYWSLFRIFSQSYRFFPQKVKLSLQYSKSFPIRRFVRRTENYPIPRKFLFLFQNGDLAALELRKFEKTCLTFIPDFLQNKKSQCFWRNMLDMYQIFPQNIPYVSAKNLKSGNLTCDFLAEVEG